MDGYFASKNDLQEAKTIDVKDVGFAKKRVLNATDMGPGDYADDRLRRFCAGIESDISGSNAASACNDVPGRALIPSETRSDPPLSRPIG